MLEKQIDNGYNQAMSNKKPITLLGLPYDASSSFLRGPAHAPPVIRQTLHNGAGNLCAEDAIELAWEDAGDLVLQPNPETAFPLIEQAVNDLVGSGKRVLSLGGDHAVTFPVVQAYTQHYEALTILHFDAHPDLYDELLGSRYSHACPFARIMELGKVKRLVQVGIRTANPHQLAQAERFGVEMVTMREWEPGLRFRFEGPVYVSLDMDVLDPAFAPGVSHHEPGGFSTRELINMLQSIEGDVVGADLVEFNPMRDVVGMTAAMAAKLVKELVAVMG